MIVYKKAKTLREIPVILTLEIPVGTFIYFGTEGKCRADTVYVKAIHGISGESYSEAKGLYDNTYIYKRGCHANPKTEFSFLKNTCASGIHFFLTMDEAIKWIG